MKKMKSPVVLTACALISLAAPGQLAGQSFDHATFDSVLALFVQDSRVDYAALKAGRSVLDRYTIQVAAVTAEDFSGWSPPDQIAYLINAYNAYVLLTVIDNYPIKPGSFFQKLISPKKFSFPDNSVRHIDGVFDGIVHKVAGQEMTLDDIEHANLRAKYNEPRVHFALVCAAASCPPLREEAYSGARLDEQLDDQGWQFLNDPRLNRFAIDDRRVEMSKIFDWFGDDFRQFAGDIGYRGDDKLNGVLTFVSRYLPDRTVAFLEGGDYSVEFLSYDWILNDQAVAAATR
jgi:hypothetical protein